MSSVVIAPIGFVHSCFKEKFGIPRQPGLVPSSRGYIQMLPPFDQEAAFLGLEECSHIWLQFVFHKNSQNNNWRATVRPPRLGGNQSIGVFASRSPYRPNGLGLSVVQYLGIERRSGVLRVNIAGLDLLDETPVLDIKPYVPYVDKVEDAHNAFAQAMPAVLPVQFSAKAQAQCEQLPLYGGINLQQLIVEVLQQDPRPAYHQVSDAREYGCLLHDWNVRWTVVDLNQASIESTHQNKNTLIIRVLSIEFQTP